MELGKVGTLLLKMENCVFLNCIFPFLQKLHKLFTSQVEKTSRVELTKTFRHLREENKDCVQQTDLG